jgi:hypothetical protein
VNLADTWDGVWDGAVALRPDGWSAELAIPLDLLSFPRAQTQDWGFLVRRTVHRTHQVYDSNLVPRSANGLVSRFGTLTGLDGLTPRGAFQITPYVTGRLSFRPQYTDPAYPEPRLTEPSADVGADLRATLTSDLTLNAAINRLRSGRVRPGGAPSATRSSSFRRSDRSSTRAWSCSSR